MATSTVTVKIEGLDAVKKQLDGLKVPKAEAHQVIAGVLKNSAKRRFTTQTAPDGAPWKPSKRAAFDAGGKTLRDTSNLMASITGRADDSAAYVGTNLAYARIHQFGGVVVPKKGKALAIPMTKEARLAGSPRNFARPLRLVWEKGEDHGWLVENKAGRGKSGYGAKSVLHYVLVHRVAIPARPFLGVSKEDVKAIGDQLLKLIDSRVRLRMQAMSSLTKS